MRVLVVAPMEIEAKAFKKALQSIKHNHTYQVCNCGIGKVNAAAEVALEFYGTPNAYDLVAVIGFAAASAKFKQGDFLIPKRAFYSDVNCPSEVAGELNVVRQLQGIDDVAIITADTFITAQNADIIMAKCGLRECIFDMESAAVCQVVDDKAPVLVMKLISDIPERQSIQDFSQFVQTHLNFSQFVHYIESLS